MDWEGAAALILELRDRALARGAPIYAEIVGFACNADSNHVTQPQASTMEVALRLALEDANLKPEAIGSVSGHGTATEWGDIAETEATRKALGLPCLSILSSLTWGIRSAHAARWRRGSESR